MTAAGGVGHHAVPFWAMSPEAAPQMTEPHGPPLGPAKNHRAAATPRWHVLTGPAS